jgi:hypothetical protein
VGRAKKSFGFFRQFRVYQAREGFGFHLLNAIGDEIVALRHPRKSELHHGISVEILEHHLRGGLINRRGKIVVQHHRKDRHGQANDQHFPAALQQFENLNQRKRR